MITNYEAAAAILSYYNLPNCPFNAVELRILRRWTTSGGFYGNIQR